METHNDNLHKGANPKLFEYAKALRQSQTHAEELLWQQLKDKKLNGLEFRRQHAISKFIGDFYCHEKKWVIEVGGRVHDLQEVKENDNAKEGWFSELGLKVIRFTNEEIATEMHKVLKEIKKQTH